MVKEGEEQVALVGGVERLAGAVPLAGSQALRVVEQAELCPVPNQAHADLPAVVGGVGYELIYRAGLGDRPHAMEITPDRWHRRRCCGAERGENRWRRSTRRLAPSA